MKAEDILGGKEPLTVTRLTVDAFKRIEAAELTPSPKGLIEVRGRNGQGKSSLIDSMLAALVGRAYKVEEPIHREHGSAEVVVDLGEIIVKRRWTRDSAGKSKAAISIEGSDGSSIRSPQAILDALTGEFADPVAFLSMSAEAQVKTVLGVMGLDSKLSRLQAQEAELFEARTVAGRDKTRAVKALEAMGEVAEPVEGGDTSALMESLKQAELMNETIREAKRQQAAIAERGGDLLKLKEQREKELERIKQEIAQLEEQIEESRNDWSKHSELANKTLLDTSELEAQIAAASSTAEERARWKLYLERQAEAGQAIEAHEELEDSIKAKRKEIGDLLSSADYPVDGMRYDPTAKSITIGGVPFSQASQAERLRAAAAVAMAGQPRIRILFVREGSLLDDNSTAELAKMVEEWGGQLWFEVVDSNKDGSGIWVEDGEVSS